MNEDISEAIFYNLKEWGKTDEEAYRMCHDEWIQAVYKRAIEKAKGTIGMYFLQLMESCEEYDKIREDFFNKNFNHS